jgi:hypothetical protein
MTNRPIAILAAVILSILMFLYVREFSAFSNTLEVKSLVLISMLVGAVFAAVGVWLNKARFMPWEEYFPSAVFILIFAMLFAPLFGSLLNRGFGSDETTSFEFVSETAYFASGYGVLKGEKLSPTGWKLVLREAGKEWRLSYKGQAYFPLTKPGEQVLIPVRQGLFGVRVVELE